MLHTVCIPDICVLYLYLQYDIMHTYLGTTFWLLQQPLSTYTHWAFETLVSNERVVGAEGGRDCWTQCLISLNREWCPSHFIHHTWRNATELNCGYRIICQFLMAAFCLCFLPALTPFFFPFYEGIIVRNVLVSLSFLNHAASFKWNG